MDKPVRQRVRPAGPCPGRCRRVGERQRPWDIVAAQVHHPEPIIRADRRHRIRGRSEVGSPGLRSGRGRGAGWSRGCVRTETTYGGKSMTERISVRGLGRRPNGGWMSADIRYRSAGVAGAIAARAPDDELRERQSAAPAIGLDRPGHDLRARHPTADLHPHIVFDDFLVPMSTARVIEEFSVPHSQQRNNSCTPTSGSSPTRNGPRSWTARTGRSRLSPIRRGSSAS